MPLPWEDYWLADHQRWDWLVGKMKLMRRETFGRVDAMTQDYEILKCQGSWTAELHEENTLKKINLAVVSEKNCWANYLRTFLLIILDATIFYFSHISKHYCKPNNYWQWKISPDINYGQSWKYQKKIHLWIS